MATTEFSRKLAVLTLKDGPAGLSPEEMVDELLRLRFPFTAESLGEGFMDRLRLAFCGMPRVLVQFLYMQQIAIEVDKVCEIAAIMDVERRRLLISEYFLVDDRLFPTDGTAIFPYGLEGTLLHEMAHLLDWRLPRSGRLSALAPFQTAFAEDIRTIPPDMRITHEERLTLCEAHGGYFNLPPDIKEKADLALFLLQEEETFADAFACLMVGMARPAVEKYFPRTIQATGELIEQYLRAVSLPLKRLPA